MKIDRSKIKKGPAEVPAECKVLIEKLKTCGSNREELLNSLKQIKTWNYGKCELYHWADVLDVFDEILQQACLREAEGHFVLPSDLKGHEDQKQLVLEVLHFTSLLIEHSFTRHLYNSMEHLTEFMSSSDMTVVLGVLNLLYVFSKRSNFITRLSVEKKQALVVRLTHLAESWGGKENGFGLAECCQQLPVTSFPVSATTLHFEFYAEQLDEKSGKKNATTVLSSIHIEDVDKMDKLAGHLMEELLSTFSVPLDKKIVLFTHIRLAQSFSTYEKRMQCVHARLLAISILVYSNAMQENVNSLLYNGFVEELVDILEIKDTSLVDIKAAALRTLTSVIHLDRNPKLQSIISATGASSYHGFLPVLVRTCIQHMTDPSLEQFPQPYATSLFSFLYHLASYESGGEALVSCGMMESLLRVVNWFGEGQEHITFVTRAVRVVDLITNLDMQAFQTHLGLSSFINRLEHEVSICRVEQPFVIKPPKHRESISNPSSPAVLMESSTSDPMDTDTGQVNEGASTSSSTELVLTEPIKLPNGKNPQCFPQRAALLKSMLNFLKKAIPDPSFSDSIRHLMDGSLPSSLKHIISNAEYYGPSLFLLATDVVTVYVYQEPSLLSSLQDNGLTDVVLHALLVKDVPATREVLSSLPNVFSALCLNARGLESFVQCKPFDRLFKVLLSPDYLPAMRRRRNSDPPGDTASSLGSAMDELMRHQPSLKTEATKAIIKLLEEVCSMGKDPSFICQKPQPKNEVANRINISMSNIGNEGGSSDEDDDDEEVNGGATGSSKEGQGEVPQVNEGTTQSQAPTSPEQRKPIPLMDYVLNVMKFVEAILSNNTTDDHCREFITQKGLEPLMSIFGLPNLPTEFPTSPSCQAVSSVCKSVLTLAHESSLLKEGLKHLNHVLGSLDLFYKFLEPPGGSILIKEFAASYGGSEPDPTLSYKSTPLLHGLAEAHAYVAMFTHVCKVGQTDIRSMSVSHWGSPEGQQALAGLSKLYTSLVWESTILLSFCSEDALPPDCDFGKKDLEKLLPKELKSTEPETSKDEAPKDAEEANNKKGLNRSNEEMGSNGVSAAMESLSTHDSPGGVPMDMDSSKTASDTNFKDTVKSEEGDKKEKKLSPQMQAQLKQIKPLLNVTSRLGKALAELFGLLVKLSVGSPVRQRRAQIAATPSTPTPAAKEVARAISKLLCSGLNWEPPIWSPIPKLRLTFYICSVGFISPMLFDDKKYPYHLMLQKFVGCGGQDAMFDTFRWALTVGGQVPPNEGLEYNELPDGTGEFLDAWLLLMERMVNVKNILESPHTLPAKPPTFKPLQFLISTHKLAFETVLFLWDKKPLATYGRWMSESLLAIICHIIKGESVIKEKLEKEQEQKEKSVVPTTEAPPSSSTPSTSATTGASGFSARTQPPVARQEPEINQAHLQQLMDMGFTRDHAVEALRHSSSLEQATDYILTHPPPPPAPIAAAIPPFPPQPTPMQQVLAGIDLREAGGSDEEQMLRAIAISLGESVSLALGESSQSPKQEDKKEPEPEPVDNDVQKEEAPIEKDVLDQFTETMFSGCMKLLDSIPESVYRVCELMSVVTARNGDKWRKDTLTTLTKEVADLSIKLMNATTPLTTSDTKSVAEWSKQLSSMEEASKLAARLHLLTLLLEEMKVECAIVVEESGILDILVRILYQGQMCITTSKETPTPKWIAPLVLLLDLYEKMAVGSKRRTDLKRMVGKVHVWKWFDDRTGKWQNYSNSNNKTIDDAYVAGDSSIRFTAGRRRYTVQFNIMVQVNEESGNRRPIMLSLPAKEENQSSSAAVNTASGLPPTSTDATKKQQNTSLGSQKDESKMDTNDEKEDLESPQHSILGLMPNQISSIIRSSVGLIGKPADPETLHAVMRLVLRLTREHQFAAQFAELGGTKLLLGLTQESGFQGFTSLTTLIFRHVVEEPSTLRHTLEKVIRTATSGTGSSCAGVATGSIGAKELNYVLRALGPAVCRDPQLFSEVAKTCIRIALPAPSKRDEDESKLTNPATPQLLKCLPSKQSASQIVDTHVKIMLQDLLNALTHNYEKEEEPQVNDVKNLADAIQEVIQDVTQEINQRSRMARQNSTADLQAMERTNSSEIEGNLNSESASENQQATQPDSKSTQEVKEKTLNQKVLVENKNQRPLLLKSSILRLLAEMIRSYAGCAHIVTSHTYKAGCSDLVPEESTSLALIMDHLLPQCQEAGDKDCPALSKVLIASLAAANHSPEAQMTLVSELKLALQRCLALSESSIKHSKIQALTGLVNTVIESCPVPGQIQNQVFKGQQSSMNNMVKLLLKKGLVTDLARIPHSLDLSSPNMASTINSALRPLETLSRIVNQPQTVVSSHKGSKSKTILQGQELDTTIVNPEISHSGPSAIGEVNATDSEIQAEGDASENLQTQIVETEATTDQEPAMDSQQESALQDVLDELLQTGESGNPEDQVLREIIMDSNERPQSHDIPMIMGVDVENDDDDDDDNHDSQMVTQEISDVEDDTDDQGHGEIEGGSDAEVDHDEDEHCDEPNTDEEDEDNDDEDDDDEDDDDEDDEDEGSDMEGDEDEYGDIHYELGNDDDLYVQLEDMLPESGLIMGNQMTGASLRNYHLPVAAHENENGNDPAGPSVPPAPSHVTANHPLLIRQADTHGISNSFTGRLRGIARNRGAYRYNPSTQTLHVQYVHDPSRATAGRSGHINILQNLLGQNLAANMLQLNPGMVNQPARFTFITPQNENRAEEDIFEDMFQDPFYDGDVGNSSVLSSVPSALTRWQEEAKVLDGDTVHDCVTLLKPDIITELEKHRDEELAERKVKRKKQAEETVKKEKEKHEALIKKKAALQKYANAEASSKGEEGATEDKEDDKTIEWGTPPEVPHPPTSLLGLAASDEGSFVTAPGPSESSMLETSESSLIEVPSINQGELTGNSQVSIESADQAFFSSNLSVSLQGSSISVSNTEETVTRERPDETGMPELGAELETPTERRDFSLPAAPIALRNFAGALGLGISNIQSAYSPVDLPPSPTSPMDTEPPPPSNISNVPPPSIPDPLPHLPPVSEIPLPPLPPHQPRDMSTLSGIMDTIQMGTTSSFGPPTVLSGSTNLASPDNSLTSLAIEQQQHQEGTSIATGTITPPIPSDITSSDNVTVNSSPISTEPNSVTDTGTPSSEQPPVSTETISSTSVTTALANAVAAHNSLASAVAGTSLAINSSTSRAQALFSDTALPEGVDPSFLAALPENIRQEVIAEQLRLQRIQQRAQEQQQQAAQLGVGEVNAEFLAALPPNIQEEVLAQQRQEQSRIATESTPVENPDVAVDPASFIATLPSALRQQVLADMDDSMVAVLPPDLASEANNLRRELEERHRRIMQERLFNQGSGPLSALLRHTGLSGRLGSRYTLRPPSRAGDHHWLFGRPRTQGATVTANTVKLRGRHLLDHEALACLLVLLFVDEPRVNSGRLHRVLRNLCYHAPTRTWVIKALLSILHKTGDCKTLNISEEPIRTSSSCNKASSDKLKKKANHPVQSSSGTLATSVSNSSIVSTPGLSSNVSETLGRSSNDLRLSQQPWLSISLDAALGCRANVFQIHRSSSGTGKKTSSAVTIGSSVDIHPQASPVVCRHVLDALISLAKSFPNQFLPQSSKVKEVTCGDGTSSTSGNKVESGSTEVSKPSSVHTSPAKTVSKSDVTKQPSQTHETDFWELLVKLDHQSTGKKGKNVMKVHNSVASAEENISINFESSPMGLLMAMLAHPVMKRSQLLTDRLLRLLGLVSVGLPDVTQLQRNRAITTVGPTSTATTSVCSTPGTTTTTVAATSLISSTLGPNVTQGGGQILAGGQGLQDSTLPLNDTMDISAIIDEHLQTSTPLPGKKDDKKEVPLANSKDTKDDAEEKPVLQNQLHLAVQVLTSKSCSEDGLEDATNLLMQLSKANDATRDNVLSLLLAGARDLGLTVCSHIRQLLSELKELNMPTDGTIVEDEESGTPPQKDSPSDRYSGIVITAPNKVKKSGRELQLPSMNLLTNKISSQQFLLRILKVIIQLRDAAKAAAKKKKKTSVLDGTISSSISEAMALLEAETLVEMVQRERQFAGLPSIPGNSSSNPTTFHQPPASGLTAAQSATTQTAGVVTTSAVSHPEAPMDVDQPGTSSSTTTPLEVDTKDANKAFITTEKNSEEELPLLPRLSEQLQLEDLWEMLGDCLTQLAKTPDHHAVLVLQPAVEAFFLVHAGEKDEKKKETNQQKREDLAHLNADITAPMSPAPHQGMDSLSSTSIQGLSRQDSIMSSSVISINLPPDAQKFLKFAEKHRTVLNQILRQSTAHLADGPFSVLVDHTRILDFDVKRRYFRQELERMEEGRGMRREDIAVHVKREHVFEDSFRELLRKSKEDWKQRFYIVFEGEEGQDAGGLIREWYLIMSREIFNPNYVLFKISPGDRVTYTVNPSSHYNSNHLSYFKFVGRFLAKAIYDNKLLDCYFTRSFYKHILGKPVKYTDMESEDYSFYQGLVFLLENNVSDLGYELTFNTDVQEFGVTSTRELKPNGKNIAVTEDNKKEYVKLVCQERMTGAIRQQLNSFLEGFYEIIPKRLIEIFNEQELELLMSGLPTIDIDDLKNNTEYHKYQANSLQIQWFWRALRSFDQTDRAAFLQFVTGTSKVPLQGFAHLEGMNGAQKFQIHRDDRSTDRLPSAHTCFNQLDLPAYETYTKLRHMLHLAFHECSEGFGLA